MKSVVENICFTIVTLSLLALIGFLMSPAFAQSEVDKLRLENLNLKMRLVEIEYIEMKKERDVLQAKVEAEQEKVKTEKKDGHHK